jgi:hypothetical protein
MGHVRRHHRRGAWQRDPLGRWAVSIPVLTSTKGAAFLINDKECDANHEDDNSDHPENNAHLEVLVQEQQDDTKSNHGVPLYKALYTRE